MALVIKEVNLTPSAAKQLRLAPPQVRRKLELWRELVAQYGVLQVRKTPGFHDEPLRAPRAGQRSIRLSLQWRAIYLVSETRLKILVIEITPHKY
jgi:proteic killer suppression protein